MNYTCPQPPLQPDCELLPMERIIPRPSLHYVQEGGTLQALAEAIAREGLRRPIIVRHRKNGRYVVVSGNRRLMACRMLGMTQIPARLMPDGVRRMPKEQLLEALEAGRMHYLEAAEALLALGQLHGLSLRELAALLGRHPQSVADQIRLCSCGEELKAFLLEEGVPMEIAIALLPLPEGPARMRVIGRIAREQLCIRDASLLVAAALHRRKEEPPAVQHLPEPAPAVQTNPRRHTGKVINAVRDPRIYLNAFRDIAGQMREAGLNAVLTESRTSSRVEVTVSLNMRRRRAARYQSI